MRLVRKFFEKELYNTRSQKGGLNMKRLEYNIEIARAPKPNNHKLNVYVEQIYIDGFGKKFIDRKLFDTILPSEKDITIKQIHNIYN